MFKVRIGAGPSGEPSVIINQVMPDYYFPDLHPNNVSADPTSIEIAHCITIGEKTYLPMETHTLVDRSGKRWAIGVYADMVSTTLGTQARNTGMINLLSGVGDDLVRVSSHGATDNCRNWERAILSKIATRLATSPSAMRQLAACSPPTASTRSMRRHPASLQQIPRPAVLRETSPTSPTERLDERPPGQAVLAPSSDDELSHLWKPPLHADWSRPCAVQRQLPGTDWSAPIRRGGPDTDTGHVRHGVPDP